MTAEAVAAPGDPADTTDPAGAAVTAAVTAAPGEADRDAGLVALKALDLDDAIAAFERCLVANPTLLECRWQLGWAHWVRSDWGAVVREWQALAIAAPRYPGVQLYLSTARGQLDVRRMTDRARAPAQAYVSTAPVGATVRLRAVGDLMIGTTFPAGSLPPDDGAGTFAAVADLLRDADVTFGNLEGPLCDAEIVSQKCKPTALSGSCYAFKSPVSYGKWYRDAGFDVMSTANNHAVDFGEECRHETEQALEGERILYSGRPGTFARWEANGLKIALIGFHTSSTGHRLTDTATAVALVQVLATENDLVIVSFHGGAEGSKALHVPEGPELFYAEDRGDLRLFTHAVIDAGADLVLGHGPHVLRAMEIYKDRLIAYSLGNFATYGRFNLAGNQGIGAILEVELARDGRLSAARVLGTRQEGLGVPVPDPANAAAALIQSLGAADFPDTHARIGEDGRIWVGK